MCTWNAETPASVPAGARISAGNSGNVARSLPNCALTLVNRSPVSCIPSPESPAKRTTTWLMVRVGMTRGAVSVTPPPLVGRSCVRQARRARACTELVLSLYTATPSCQRIERAKTATRETTSAASVMSDRLRPNALSRSGDGDVAIEVDVLDGVQQFYALGHGTLKGLAARDQPHATRPFVDDCRLDRSGQVAGALGFAAAVDQADATHVTVRDLPAAQIDRVLGGQLAVDEFAGLAVSLEGVVATVVLGQLLLDDVGFDRDAEVVGLAGEVGRHVIVDAVLLEARVAQVAPQDGEHAQLMRPGEGLADLFDLAGRLIRAEVDRRPDTGGTEVIGLLYRAEHHLVELVGECQELVVVELDDERDAVRIAPRHHAEHAEGRRDCVAAALDEI